MVNKPFECELISRNKLIMGLVILFLLTFGPELFHLAIKKDFTMLIWLIIALISVLSLLALIKFHKKMGSKVKHVILTVIFLISTAIFLYLAVFSDRGNLFIAYCRAVIAIMMGIITLISGITIFFPDIFWKIAGNNK